MPENYTTQNAGERRTKRLAALKRGLTQWGHAGRHSGHYTDKQIAAGAPDCPIPLHHHHDDYCAMPSPSEMREAGVETPEGGWHSRA